MIDFFTIENSRILASLALLNKLNSCQLVLASYRIFEKNIGK